MLSERKLPAARINLFSSFHFLVFIESHVLPLLHEENAPFPVHQEDYSHQKAHQMGVWKQQMEKLSWNEQRFNRYCVLSIGSYEVRKCLFIWKCHRCYYTLLRLFRRVNCVVTEQRSGCIISCLSAPVFFFFLSFFFLSRDAGPIILLCCHTPPISSQRTANTHILTHRKRQTANPHAPKHRHNEPTEDRHHISTEVVNRPSEAFLKGVSSSAFIEPLSDY